MAEPESTSYAAYSEHLKQEKEEEDEVTAEEATEAFVSSITALLSGDGEIECDPKTFNPFCESNPFLPHKLVIIEVDEFGPNRIFFGLSHRADRSTYRWTEHSTQDVLMGLVNDAMTAHHIRYHYEMEGDQEQKKWEMKTFGAAPTAGCRPNGDSSDWRGNQIPLMHPIWCSNDNALCHQDSRPCSKHKYQLHESDEVIVVDPFSSGETADDYLKLFCAYSVRQKMVRASTPCHRHFSVRYLLEFMALPSEDINTDFIVLSSLAFMLVIAILIGIGMWIKKHGIRTSVSFEAVPFEETSFEFQKTEKFKLFGYHQMLNGTSMFSRRLCLILESQHNRRKARSSTDTVMRTDRMRISMDSDSSFGWIIYNK